MGAGTAWLRTDPAGPPEPGPEGTRPARRPVPPALAVGLATLAAAAVVLDRLGARSLWFDEGITVGLVREPFGTFVQRVTDHEVNQSAFYVVFNGWYRLVGEGPAAMRLLSAACFVATVPLVYVLGRRLFDRSTGVLASVLVAIHPLAIEWGQQLRGYAMVLFLVTLATYLLVRAVEDPTPARVLLYAAVAVVAVYTHFFAALVVGAHAVSLGFRRPFPRRVAGGAVVVLAALCAPAAVFVLGRNGDPLRWIDAPRARGLVDRLGGVAGGGLLQLVVYGGAALLGLAVVVRIVRRAPWSDEAWRAAVPALWLVLPPLVVLVSTYTVKPLLISSYLIVVVPALAIVSAAGLTRISRPNHRVAAVTALVVVSLLGWLGWRADDGTEQWRPAVEVLRAEAQTDDGVVVVPTQARGVVGYYLRHPDGPPLRVLTPSAEDPAGPEVLWQIRRDTLRERLPDWDPLQTYARWRDEHYRLVEEWSFERVALERYERIG
jgi:mannosyltransferase